MKSSLALFSIVLTALASPSYQRVVQQETLTPSSATHITGNLPCEEEGFLPDPTDCKKFIRCVSDGNGTFRQYRFDCAPGTDLWCQSLLTCSFAFQCPETCSSAEIDRSEAAKCDAFSCTAAGFFADPFSCSKFHECEKYLDGSEIKFNDTVKQCDEGVFCAIVEGCGSEEGCPQDCDRSCH